MKIKKKIQGNSQLSEVVEVAGGAACPYQAAIDCIKCAIDALAELPDDELAKDSIANLSVVLLDLNC